MSLSEKNMIISLSDKNYTIHKIAGDSSEHINFMLMVGSIKISEPISRKRGVVHITTGRADSLEGGDFKVSELEIAIQDFFDKKF